jgi:cytochrome c5
MLAIVAMSLIMASCDKSGETADTAVPAVTVDEAATVKSTADSDTQAVEALTDAAEEAVASAETETTAPAVEASAGVTNGEAIYRKYCASCHMTGAAGAPKTGDKDAWSPRISKGIDALVQSAIAGVPGTAMMARGACNSCTDAEIEAAVRYIIEQAQ